MIDGVLVFSTHRNVVDYVILCVSTDAYDSCRSILYTLYHTTPITMAFANTASKLFSMSYPCSESSS